MTPSPEPRTARAGGGPPELPEHLRVALRDRAPEALEAFYDAYFDRIHGYVRRLLRDEHLAEDLTQEILMNVLQAFPRYDPGRPLRPWVFTIATNKLRDFWGSRRFQELQRSASTDDAGSELAEPELSADGPGPSARLEASETAVLVQRAIAGLPDTLRTTLVLRYYHGLSFEEIGDIEGRTAVAVRKRYSRALRELKGRLASRMLNEDVGGQP